jgi:hypothetical protein
MNSNTAQSQAYHGAKPAPGDRKAVAATAGPGSPCVIAAPVHSSIPSVALKRDFFAAFGQNRPRYTGIS